MSKWPEIGGIEKVTDVFGAWPSFHDAEILRLVLDRDPDRAGEAPTLMLQVRLRRYQEQGVGTVAFELALTHDFIIDLVFADISELNLAGFNGQNVIDDIDLRYSEGDGAILVRVDSIFGISATWQCRSVAVSDLRGAVHGAA